ncbi:MAG TPA: hypothetical protein VGE58_10055, partial [Daejeonella sp.]
VSDSASFRDFFGGRAVRAEPDTNLCRTCHGADTAQTQPKPEADSKPSRSRLEQLSKRSRTTVEAESNNLYGKSFTESE